MDDDITAIADELEADVRGLKAGTRLPSEHMLMRRFGVSRSVVRRAIERLEQRYLVRRSQGAGMFVNRRVDFVISSQNAPSLHDTIAQTGSVVRTFVVESDVRPVPLEIAERLGVAQGTEMDRLVRIGYIDDEPATYGEEWIAPGVLGHIEVALRAIESLAEVLRSARRNPVRAWSRVATDFAPAEVERRLGLHSSGVLWHIETLTRDGAEGAPLMYSRAWQRPDRVRVVIEFTSSS